MLRIGVTGLMASGKSTVARQFGEHGARLIDADTIGWGVLRRPEIVEALGLAFGRRIVGPDGAIDRGELGRIVFRDPGALDRLNAIVQPALLAEVRRELRSTAGPVVVVDAALLTAWRLEPELDGVVEVVAPEEARVSRLRLARGFGEEEARQRIQGQRLPPVGGARRHWKIENTGDVPALRARADAIWTEIEALAGR
jgi:dephospho-CoA kinase